VVHTLALAEALASAGAAVTVHAVAPEPGEGFFREVDPAVAVELHDRRPTAEGDVDARVLASIDALSAGVDPAGYDVVHAQDCISANAVAGAVRTVHHLDDFTSPVLAECHERAIVEPAAHVCVSRGVAAELRAGWGIEATVIPNGVRADRFAAAAGADEAAVAARARWRDRLGGDPLVLTVGGIEPRKGTLDLVEAVAAARGHRPGLRLAVAGGETLFDYRPYRARVEQRCRELDLEPLVLGPVADDDLPALVAACDVFVLASIKEGFGLAAMEALAARRPVVLRDLAVFSEVFGSAAVLGAGPVGIAEGIERALERPPDPSAGAELAAAHTWDRAAARHLALYERLAA
jgi:glycosyltransferase-like protein